jgi:hypothetical protein
MQCRRRDPRVAGFQPASCRPAMGHHACPRAGEFQIVWNDHESSDESVKCGASRNIPLSVLSPLKEFCYGLKAQHKELILEMWLVSLTGLSRALVWVQKTGNGSIQKHGHLPFLNARRGFSAFLSSGLNECLKRIDIITLRP